MCGVLIQKFMLISKNLKRNINENYKMMSKGIWKKIEGQEIFNKKVGIIGLGAAGKEVAKRFYYFGSKPSFSE